MTKTQLVLVTAGVAALAGGGTALAAKSHSQTGGSAAHVGALAHHGGHGDDLDAAATYLGTTTSDLLAQLQAGKTLAQIAGSKTSGLIAALVAHEKQEIADAVKAGRLTQAQADQVAPTLTQRFTDLVNGVRPAGGPGFGPGHGPGGGHGDDLDAAATYLGTTTSDLVTQLQAGKTLAQIAGSKTSGLVAALVAHEKQEIADAVKAGRLTQAQSDQIVPTLTQHFTDLVNGTFREHGGPPHDFGSPPGARA
jgi:polyhydroxyalkanoate synthesis regulator phasin